MKKADRIALQRQRKTFNNEHRIARKVLQRLTQPPKSPPAYFIGADPAGIMGDGTVVTFTQDGKIANFDKGPSVISQAMYGASIKSPSTLGKITSA